MHPVLTSQLKSGLITVISNIALFRDPDHLFLHLIELFALVASTHTAVAGLHHRLSLSLLTATPEHFIHYEYARHLFLGRTGRPSALSRRYVARSLFLPFPSSHSPRPSFSPPKAEPKTEKARAYPIPVPLSPALLAKDPMPLRRRAVAPEPPRNACESACGAKLTERDTICSSDGLRSTRTSSPSLPLTHVPNLSLTSHVRWGWRVLRAVRSRVRDVHRLDLVGRDVGGLGDGGVPPDRRRVRAGLAAVRS